MPAEVDGFGAAIPARHLKVLQTRMPLARALSSTPSRLGMVLVMTPWNRGISVTRPMRRPRVMRMISAAAMRSTRTSS